MDEEAEGDRGEVGQVGEEEAVEEEVVVEEEGIHPHHASWDPSKKSSCGRVS